MDWLLPARFSRPERLWIFGFFLAAAALTTAPYLAFYALTPVHQQYAWASVFYYDDYFQYYAWARHVARGEWLIRNYYTDNPAARYAMFNPFFFALGIVARALGNVYGAYHLVRVAAIGAFAWISYAFIALFLREPRLRRTAQLLLLGGGLEYPWFMLAARMGAREPRIPTPLADPYVFKALYRYGHLTAALALLLLALGIFIELGRGEGAGRGRRAISPAICAVASMTLGLINPYYLVLLAALVASFTAWRLIRGDARPLAPALAAGVGAVVPLLQYKAQTITGNLGAIAFDDPICASDFVLFFAPLLPLAAAGWWGSRRLSNAQDAESAAESEQSLVVGLQSRPTSSAFLVLWVLVVFALVLSPLRFRARMTFGLQLPLAILAAIWLGRGRLLAWRRWPIYALMALEVGFTFYKEAVDFDEKGVGKIDLSAMVAFDWLDAHAAPGEVVLTSVEVGDYLPAYCMQSVYVGHSFQSDDFYERNKTVNRFFLQMTDAQRLEFLASTRVDYVLVPPIARAKNRAFALPGWPLALRESGYEIYRKASMK